MTCGRLVVLTAFLSVSPTVRPCFAQCPDGSPPPCRAQPTRATPAPPPNSVAVLYFDNLSRDTTDAYLADGLTEEIIARLGQIERLEIKSRTAVQRYRGKPADDPAAVGRRLGVAYLLNGSVRRSGPRLRVTTELVRAATGTRVWGEQFDRQGSDVLAIEEDVARAVATAVGGRLLPAERALLTSRPTRNPAAYDHFLRGNYYLAQRNPRSVARAIEEYYATLRLDPGFLQALPRAALAYGIAVWWGWDYRGLPADSLLARGFQAADAALQRDSTASEAWMARAVLLAQRHPRTFEGARAAFARAIALDPRNADAHHHYGVVLRELGDDSGAVAEYERALAVEPERAITLHDLGYMSLVGRRDEQARYWLDSALAANPGFFLAYALRAQTKLRLGETARADAETAVRLSSGFRLPGEAALVRVDVLEGDTLTARARVDSLLAETAHQEHPTPLEGIFVASALLAVGQREQALDYLERVRPRGGAFWFHLRRPEFDPLGTEPRFQRLVEESRPPGAPR